MAPHHRKRLLLFFVFTCGWSTIIAPAASGPTGSYATLTVDRRKSMQQEVRLIISLLENYHYRSKPLVELDPAVLLQAYLERLDPQRAYFLANDEQFILRRFSRSLKSSYLLSGDLYPAFEIFDRFRERHAARHDWIQQRLAQPFTLDRAETLALDRREVPRPETPAAADAWWEKWLTVELIDELLLDDDLDAARARLRDRHEQAARHLAQATAEDVAEQFLGVLLALHDPHSGYDSWKSRLDLDVEMSGTLVGIGADLKLKDGAVIVDNLLPGGAAELSGRIQVGDHILAVADGTNDHTVAVTGLTLAEVVRRIRGDANTAVRLEVQPSEGGERRIVELTRTRLESQADRAVARLITVPAHDSFPSAHVGVIRLPAFYGEYRDGEVLPGSAADVQELTKKLRAAGAQALVLDLRRNPGGYIGEAVRIVGLFIDTGPAVLTRGLEARTVVLRDDEPGAAFAGPLVVLTSQRSASASELLAGALQAYRRAVIVGGESTFGKGTSQIGRPLAEMAGAPDAPGCDKWGTLRLTVDYFYLPDGNSNQLNGVPSDIVLPEFTPEYAEREADLPGALPWQRLPVNDFAATRESATRGLATATPELIERLRAGATSRRDTLPEFDWYRRAIERYGAIAARDTASLDRTQRRAQRTHEADARRAIKRERRELGRQLDWSAQPVRLDASVELENAHAAKIAHDPLPDGRPRAGNFHHGIYYHRMADDTLREIRAGALDFEALLDDAAALAEACAAGAGAVVATATMEQLLHALDDAENINDPPLEERLAALIGLERRDPRTSAALSAMFARLVELHPELIDDFRSLDVPLRESLRVAADWIASTAESP